MNTVIFNGYARKRKIYLKYVHKVQTVVKVNIYLFVLFSWNNFVELFQSTHIYLQNHEKTVNFIRLLFKNL